jgi:glycosyltransferase involved in cell wall biosynthesis
MRAVRVVLLSPLPPERTGIADYAAHWRRAVNGAGVEVLTPLQGQRPVQSLQAARRWVSERDWSKVDVVHAELGGGRHGEFFVLAALAEMPDRPALSATVHDPERLVWKPLSSWWRSLDAAPSLPRWLSKVAAVLADPHTLLTERRLARRLDGLVTLTRTGAQALSRRMRLPVERVSVIPHGVLRLPAVPLPDDVALRVLYFGYIYSGKGIEDLIDAVAQVFKQQPEQVGRIRLTIAGGTAPDIAFGGGRSYLDELRARVADRGLNGHVDWELDVEEPDIPHLIQRHHVVVLPYRESRKLSLLGQMRGTSGALAWAIGCGRAVITSDARAFAEEITQGNGVAYRQGQVGQLAQALHALLIDPDHLKRWTRVASDVAEARQWDRIGHAFAGHFQQVLQRRGSAHPRRRA